MPGIWLTVTLPPPWCFTWRLAGQGPWAAGMDRGRPAWTLGGWPAGTAGSRWPGGPGHYARTHDRGAVIAAGRARHPGDAQRAARARFRHRPAHRARRRAGPDLAHPPAGRLPVDRPA